MRNENTYLPKKSSRCRFTVVNSIQSNNKMINNFQFVRFRRGILHLCDSRRKWKKSIYFGAQQNDT